LSKERNRDKIDCRDEGKEFYFSDESLWKKRGSFILYTYTAMGLYRRSRSRVAANEPLDEEELLRSRHLQRVENNGRQIELICCNW
jgi:hypothetical protein